jgi:hypothetical protein
MADGKLPIIRAVGLVLRDIIRVAQSMPGLTLTATAILFAFNVLDLLTAPHLPDGPLVPLLKEVGLRVAESFLLTPFLIAVHRFILIDETTARYAIAPRSPRFERFFAWSVLIWLLTASVSLLRPLAEGVPTGIGIGAVVVASVAVFVISLRLTILFPAIAIDAPGASVSNTFADTRGHVIGMLLIFLLANLPVVVFFVLVMLLFPIKAIESGFSAATIPFAAVLGVFQLVIYTTMVAAASRIFQAVAERVLRAPPSA